MADSGTCDPLAIGCIYGALKVFHSRIHELIKHLNVSYYCWTQYWNKCRVIISRSGDPTPGPSPTIGPWAVQNQAAEITGDFRWHIPSYASSGEVHAHSIYASGGRVFPLLTQMELCAHAHTCLMLVQATIPFHHHSFTKLERLENSDLGYNS